MFEYRKEKGKKKERRQPKPSTSRPSSSLSPPLPAWAASRPSFPSPEPLSPLSLFLHGPARASHLHHVHSRPQPLSQLPSSARPAPPVRRFFPLAPTSVFPPPVRPLGRWPWPALPHPGPSPLYHAQPSYALAWFPRPDSSRRAPRSDQDGPQRPVRSGSSVDPHAEAANPSPFLAAALSRSSSAASTSPTFPPWPCAAAPPLRLEPPPSTELLCHRDNTPAPPIFGS
jgi:hypothetical protein